MLPLWKMRIRLLSHWLNKTKKGLLFYQHGIHGSLMVKRERCLPSYGLDARKRTCRGRFLQKKWCTEYATMLSLKPSIKWITFPVT